MMHLFLLIGFFCFSQNIIEFSELNLPQPKMFFQSKIALFSNEDSISFYLIDSINNSTGTLDIAIYSFTNHSISDAIIKAHERGVKVRVIIEYSKVMSSKIDPAVQKLIDKKIPIRYLRGSGMYGVMHNKFLIIDKKQLITGSYNFTSFAENNNYENMVFVYDEQNITSYLNYFETMWKKARDVYSNYKASYNDFSTSLFTMISSIRNTLIKLIDGSQKTIDIAVYSISDEDIYKSLVRAKQRGVKIRIITDRLQATQSTTIKKLYSDGFDIKISNGYNNGVMHNKYAIFDEKIVVTGSFNWSNNAENYNWENLIILDKSYVPFFLNNFETIYKKSFVLSVSDFQASSQSFSSSSR